MALGREGQQQAGRLATSSDQMDEEKEAAVCRECLVGVSGMHGVPCGRSFHLLSNDGKSIAAALTSLRASAIVEGGVGRSTMHSMHPILDLG